MKLWKPSAEADSMVISSIAAGGGAPAFSASWNLARSARAPIQGPPASLLGPEPLPCTTPLVQPDVVMDWASASARSEQGPGGTGNGAPVDPVTGAPHPRGGSELLVSRETGTGTRMGEKTAPLRREPDRQVSEPDVIIPTFEQLFGDGGESR